MHAALPAQELHQLALPQERLALLPPLEVVGVVPPQLAYEQFWGVVRERLLCCRRYRAVALDSAAFRHAGATPGAAGRGGAAATGTAGVGTTSAADRVGGLENKRRERRQAYVQRDATLAAWSRATTADAAGQERAGRGVR